jgi:ElaB/YqjD/DUF883 family membrane-anchored ribosome-binding protein
MVVLANKENDSRRAAEQHIRETRRDFDKRIDEIRAELRERGPDAAEKVERSLNDLKKDLQNGFDDIHGEFDDELETRREQVREHPLLAVGIAVIGGVILGMLLGKSRD